MKISWILIGALAWMLANVCLAGPVKTINESGWDIEIQDDATCALGKIYSYGKNDSLIFIINSFGRISLVADKGFNEVITVDEKISFHPMHSSSDTLYTYATKRDDGDGIVRSLKSGRFITVIMNDHSVRQLSLSGFTKAYNQYLKCARN